MASEPMASRAIDTPVTMNSVSLSSLGFLQNSEPYISRLPGKRLPEKYSSHWQIKINFIYPKTYLYPNSYHQSLNSTLIPSGVPAGNLEPSSSPPFPAGPGAKGRWYLLKARACPSTPSRCHNKAVSTSHITVVSPILTLTLKLPPQKNFIKRQL